MREGQKSVNRLVVRSKYQFSMDDSRVLCPAVGSAEAFPGCPAFARSEPKHQMDAARPPTTLSLANHDSMALSAHS